MAGKKSGAEVAEVDQPAQVIQMSQRQDAVSTVTTLTELKAVFNNQQLDWSDIEPSFKIVDQEFFEDIPFVIAGFRLNESSSFGKKQEDGTILPSRFISMLCASYDDEGNLGEWVVVNDGSTGIKDQLARYLRKVNDQVDLSLSEFNLTAAEIPAIRCANGLRPSRYPFEDEQGNVSTATTWYIK